MLSVKTPEEVLALIESEFAPLAAVETVSLSAAMGRVLAEDIATTEYVPGCSSTYAQFSYRVAMPVVQRNLDLLDRVNEILESAGMRTLAPVALGGGSDAADVTAAGIPCLDGMGPEGGGVHSLREFAVLASLPASTKQLATILDQL